MPILDPSQKTQRYIPHRLKPKCELNKYKLGDERQIPCDLMYKWNLTTQTSDQNRAKDM